MVIGKIWPGSSRALKNLFDRDVFTQLLLACLFLFGKVDIENAVFVGGIDAVPVDFFRQGETALKRIIGIFLSRIPGVFFWLRLFFTATDGQLIPLDIDLKVIFFHTRNGYAQPIGILFFSDVDSGHPTYSCESVIEPFAPGAEKIIKKSDQSLSEKFLEGLKKYNITYDEITNSGWKYIGGDSGADLRYFKLCCKGREMPKHIRITSKLTACPL